MNLSNYSISWTLIAFLFSFRSFVLYENSDNHTCYVWHGSEYMSKPWYTWFKVRFIACSKWYLSKNHLQISVAFIWSWILFPFYCILFVCLLKNVENFTQINRRGEFSINWILYKWRWQLIQHDSKTIFLLHKNQFFTPFSYNDKR